jgi:hypothetical protein
MAFHLDREIQLSVRRVIAFTFIFLLIIDLVSLHVAIVIIHYRYFGIGCSSCHVLPVVLVIGLSPISPSFIFRVRGLVNATFIAVFSVFAV